MQLSVFVLIYISTVVCFIFLSFLYFNEKNVNKIKCTHEKALYLMIAMMVVGFLLRMLFFAAVRGYDSDIGCWIGWGNSIINDGYASFYTAPGHEWYDYPPGYMYVLAYISFMSKLLKLTDTAFLGRFIYILPPIIADIVSSALIYNYCLSKNDFEKSRIKGLIGSAFILFNPAVFFLSGAWGQIDSVFTLFIILTFLNMAKKNYWLMGIFYGLAITIKWQAFIFGPVLVLALLASFDYKNLKDRKKIPVIVSSGIVAALILLVAAYPFRGDQKALWIFDRFHSSTGGYNYASIEAYNFMTMFGANWEWADNPFILGISYKTFGTIMIIVFIILVTVSYLIDRFSNKLNDNALRERIFLHAAFFMYGVYTFGHYMHERYIFPVIILLMFAFMAEKKKDLLFSNVLLSSVVFFNEMVALYVAKPGAIDTIRFGSEHKTASIVCGVLEVASFAYFAYVYFTRNRLSKTTE